MSGTSALRARVVGHGLDPGAGTFLDSWNNFLWPLIVVTSTNQMTLPLGLATFQGAHSTEWTLLMAGNVMSLVPMLLIFFAAQRYFIRSVAATRLAGT
jgi:multiple sugar transport system permease protein